MAGSLGVSVKGELMELIARSLRKLPKQTRTIVSTCLYGLCAGFAAVAFQLGITWTYRLGLVLLSHQSFEIFAAGSLAVIVGSSAIVGWLLLSFCGEAAGCGVPQRD